MTTRGRRAAALLAMLSASPARAAAAQDAPAEDPHAAHRAAMGAPVPEVVSRVMPVQPMPGEISFVDRHGRATTLRAALDTDLPVLVNFIFTTCTTVCPIMSRGFAQLQERLGPDRDRVRLVSISIDPETDSVDVLEAYAKRYQAQDAWWLLTGTREASVSAQRAFGAYRGDKMNHAPATFVRRSRDAPWEVIEGLSSGASLQSVSRDSPPPAER
jgi:protein SCO1/2